MQNNYQPRCKPIDRQQGWTMWSLMFVMGVILFFAYIGMQLVPVYTTNGSITNAMNQTVDDVDLYKATRSSVITKIKSQLYIDGNHELIDYKTELKVKRSKTNFTLTTEYDREIPLFYNLSVLVKFNNVVERDLNR